MPLAVWKSGMQCHYDVKGLCCKGNRLIELRLPLVQDFRVLTLLYVCLFTVAMVMTVLPVEGRT